MTVVAEASASAPKALTLCEKGHAVPLSDNVKAKLTLEGASALESIGAYVTKALKLRDPVHCSIVSGDHLGCMVPRGITHDKVRAAIRGALSPYQNGTS